MDWLLQHIADIFRYSTSLLIAWGFFSSHTIFKILLHSHEHRGLIRKADAWYFIAMILCTGFLTGSLFIFPLFASKYMFALIVFELWYGMFAAYFTYMYIKPCIEGCTRMKILTNRHKSELHN